MSLTFVGKMNVPTYTALSTDIVAGAISGASIVGGTVFITDLATWYIVGSDLQLVSYALPVEITIDPGSINIGSVSVDQPVAGAITLSPLHGTQDVAVPGSSEPLTATSTKVIMVVVMARSTNVSTVYLGDGSVDKTSSKQMILQPGTSVSIDAPLGYNFSLSNLYLDAEIANDGVDYIAMR